MDYRTPAPPEVNEKLAYDAGGAQTEAAQPGQPGLLNRLHRRRRELQNELRRVNNSIELCEKNAGMVEIVEIVLLSREKADRPY